MENALLYQAYGGPDFVNECRYSLLKLLQVYNLAPPRSTQVVVYTDAADAFFDFLPYIESLVFRPVSAETIRQWRGNNNFVHRVKVEMIADFLSGFSGNLLYCDTDVYAVAPLESLFANIESGSRYMHEYEGVIDRTKFPAFAKWEKFLSNASLTYNSKPLHFNNSLPMFNAGVLGFRAADRELVKDVLALTDAVYQQFPKHIAEQFAFSYCLHQKGKIKEAKPVLAHYWNLKEFRELLRIFFERAADESIPTLVKKVQHLDALFIMREKMAYENQPFLQRLFRKISRREWSIERYAKKL